MVSPKYDGILWWFKSSSGTQGRNLRRRHPEDLTEPLRRERRWSIWWATWHVQGRMLMGLQPSEIHAEQPLANEHEGMTECSWFAEENSDIANQLLIWRIISYAVTYVFLYRYYLWTYQLPYLDRDIAWLAECPRKKHWVLPSNQGSPEDSNT